MNNITLYIMYAGLFLTALLLIEGMYFLIHDLRSGSKDINRRMRLINKEGDNKAGLALLRVEKQGGFTALARSLFPSLTDLMWTAGVVMPIGRLLTFMVALGLFSFLFLETVTPAPLILTTSLSIAIGFGFPYGILKIRSHRRQKAFTNQLTPAIDLIVRGLEAGHPVTSALSLVADQMPDPIGSEFGIAVDEMTYGLSMQESLDNMARRFPNQDLRFLIISVQIQRVTGGNLVEILTNLSEVIRARVAMQKKIRAVSAEGRLSGWIVGCLPFLVAGFIWLTNPQFFTEVMDDELFIPLQGMAALLLALGAFTIWKLVRIKI
ncbi:MAG: type II secretion system F family protein [Alphaproteobacteria bacterium]|nr:MAG: type II secretion system F family protein [Alphaproteobacteria bacterium]